MKEKRSQKMAFLKTVSKIVVSKMLSKVEVHLRIRQRPKAGASPSMGSQGPALGRPRAWTVWGCPHLKILISLEDGALHFHFVPDPADYTISSGQLVSFLGSSSLCSQRMRRELKEGNGHFRCKSTSQSFLGANQTPDSPAS